VTNWPAGDGGPWTVLILVSMDDGLHPSAGDWGLCNCIALRLASSHASSQPASQPPQHGRQTAALQLSLDHHGLRPPVWFVKITMETDKLWPLSFIQGKGAKAGFSQNLSVPLRITFCNESGLLWPGFPQILEGEMHFLWQSRCLASGFQ
jgi:hypothetical protein